MRVDPALSTTGLTVELDLSALEVAVASLAQHEPDALAELMRQTRLHSGRDALTGAWERGAGMDQLHRAVDRAHRTGEPLVVVFVDLDHLKQMNDGGGHAIGDLALRATADALLRGLRSYDLVLRYGGDEFVCALPHAGVAQAESRLCQVARLLDDACPGARLSAGFALLQPDQSADDVVQDADQDMYARRRVLRAVPPA